MADPIANCADIHGPVRACSGTRRIVVNKMVLARLSTMRETDKKAGNSNTVIQAVMGFREEGH